MSRMSGSTAMARAMATRCFMPPESWCGSVSANLVRPTFSMVASAFSSAARPLSFPLARSAKTTFSFTVFQGRS